MTRTHCDDSILLPVAAGALTRSAALGELPTGLNWLLQLVLACTAMVIASAPRNGDAKDGEQGMHQIRKSMCIPPLQTHAHWAHTLCPSSLNACALFTTLPLISSHALNAPLLHPSVLYACMGTIVPSSCTAVIDPSDTLPLRYDPPGIGAYFAHRPMMVRRGPSEPHSYL